MKKIFLTFTILLVGLIFVSCADKEPFKAKEAKATAALVYIYIAEDSNIDDTFRISTYNVALNGNVIGKSLRSGEYIKLDLKPIALTISLARLDLEIQSVKLNLQAGQTYYLRAQSHSASFGKFDFKEVDSSIGSQEIANTVSSSEYIIEGNVMDALIKSDNSNSDSQMSEDEINAMIEKKLKAMGSSTAPAQAAPVQSVAPSVTTSSKLNDIKNAYKMKEDGLLTEEEFKAMKAEILAK